MDVGDALFGANVKPNTYITVGTGGVGTYTVNTSQSSSSGTIIARVAVLGSPTANSYTVSRRPTTRLSGSARVCGGVCAMFFDAANSKNTAYTLTNLGGSDDYTSGFACLKGVDPDQIKTLSVYTTKRTSWSEPVQ